jgi:hypothetical protein
MEKQSQFHDISYLPATFSSLLPMPEESNGDRQNIPEADRLNNNRRGTGPLCYQK